MRRLAAVALVALACAGAPEPGLPSADLIFVGEHVLTMDPAIPEADAVAVSGERIVAVGSRRAVLRRRGPATRVVELGERALLPGFVDAHGHVAMVARLIDWVNLSSPPVGPAERVGDVVSLLRARLAERAPAPGSWLVGYGYDDSLLAERRHPTRDDLDRVSSEHPVVIVHVSFHLASVNSTALAALGIDAATPDPPGGLIRRRPGTREPNGVLEETAASGPLFARLGAESADLEAKLRRTLRLYASYGITTAQDGAAALPDAEAFRAMAARDPFAIDVLSYPLARTLDAATLAQLEPGPYENGFRVAGVKYVLDGSIQGKTGYLSEPYLNPPEGQGADWRAYPHVTQPALEASLAPVLRRGLPALVHANGDAACQMLIDAVAAAFPDPAQLPDHRTVMIHAQMLREDQLDRVAELRIVPSYYAAHPFFWGDWHRDEVIGPERAARISPIRSTVVRGIPFTIHNDAPIVPPDVMRLVEIAVTRKTRSGRVLGPEQRATVAEALHAVTLAGAYQSFEEDTKGSITPGKQADLVVLAASPLDVEPERLDEIAVVETFARGASVYSAP